MGITRRILDGAKDSWSKLTSLVIVDDEPLSHVEPAALQAELTARKAAHRDGAEPSRVAKMATSSAQAKAERQRQAAMWQGRRTRTSTSTTDETRTARPTSSGSSRVNSAEEAFRRMKAAAAGGGARSTSSGRTPRAGSAEAQRLEWYKTLDVEPGSDAATLKTSYRKLMRKYHPDVHAGDPTKLKAATELSVRVTAAYDGLIAELNKK